MTYGRHTQIISEISVLSIIQSIILFILWTDIQVCIHKQSKAIGEGIKQGSRACKVAKGNFYMHIFKNLCGKKEINKTRFMHSAGQLLINILKFNVLLFNFEIFAKFCFLIL